AIPLCPPDHRGVADQYHLQTCKSPGKVPMWGWKTYQERLPKPNELKVFWDRNPYCNVGVIMGRVSKLVGIDIDGPQAEGMLLEISGKFEFLYGVGFNTPGGGRRLLYTIEDQLILKRHFKSTTSNSHVIILGEGSLTVMPPSEHSNGK